LKNQLLLERQGFVISKLKNEILREVGMLGRCIQSISDIKFREIQLQRGQFTFVTRICENPGIHLVELSDLLKVDKATTTKAIQKLIEEGYVLKERSRQDKRMWHLFPSAKAQQYYPYIIEEENGNIDSCCKDFSYEEKVLVYQLLKRMRENIERDWKKLKKVKEK
jgi:DNA-binding MarR family transcriptional regulator